MVFVHTRQLLSEDGMPRRNCWSGAIQQQCDRALGTEPEGQMQAHKRDPLPPRIELVDAIFAAQTRLRRQLGRVLTDCTVASICACTDA